MCAASKASVQLRKRLERELKTGHPVLTAGVDSWASVGGRCWAGGRRGGDAGGSGWNENAAGPRVRSIESAKRIKFHRGVGISVFLPATAARRPLYHRACSSATRPPFLFSDAVQPTPRKINRMTMASSNIYTSNFRPD